MARFSDPSEMDPVPGDPDCCRHGVFSWCCNDCADEREAEDNASRIAKAVELILDADPWQPLGVYRSGILEALGQTLSPLPCGCHCLGGCGDPYAACMNPCAKHVPI